MTSKFEQLIEFVINDEEAKAKELFHDIVVEKSREIYENLMDESEEVDADELDAEDDAEDDNEDEEDRKAMGFLTAVFGALRQEQTTNEAPNEGGV